QPVPSLVLEAAVRVLTNPMFLKVVLVLFASGFAFMMAVLLMRRIRKSFAEDFDIPETAASAEQLPLHTYHAVIQQLKQQKHELLALQQAEQRRAKTSESISAAVLSNLSSGVLFFGTNGLVRQANQAAKSILGIASPSGMDAVEIFRNATPEMSTQNLAASVNATLMEGTPLRKMETEYMTPTGERRGIEVTASPVPAPGCSILSAAFLLH